MFTFSLELLAVYYLYIESYHFSFVKKDYVQFSNNDVTKKVAHVKSLKIAVKSCQIFLLCSKIILNFL